MNTFFFFQYHETNWIFAPIIMNAVLNLAMLSFRMFLLDNDDVPRNP